ncbi:hypothetical protein [Zavarzinella formosa]|uniref:hypothetical protein n=1 Tax=Zavarzinella formosa TaxID=360055 RepID=UPI00036DA59C|nr:hypothetical protein [Zavarzinella formosa]
MKNGTWVIALAVIFGICSPSQAGDDEDQAAVIIKNLGGRAVRDEARPGKPVVKVYLDSSTARKRRMLTSKLSSHFSNWKYLSSAARW